jgi:predicted metalloendopeptidase
MAKELKEAFIGRIASRDWITNSTKALVEEKAEEVLVTIGVPENVGFCP